MHTPRFNSWASATTKDILDRPIEDLFVDPYTASQRISPDTLPEQWPETSPLFELVSFETRLVLLGDPGCGKSTLVSWIVWNLAREGENRWKQALNHRTPIVMVLREMSLERVRTWDDLLAAYLKHWTARLFGRPRYASHVNGLLEGGRAMIMLDGLDEVGNPQVRQNLRQAVWEGMRRYEGCTWLLTSRVVGYLGYHEGPEIEAPDACTRRILRVLLEAEHEEIPQIWTAFVNTMREADAVALCLAGTPTDSVAPFANLSGLRVLDLFNTRVIDLSQISSLAGLGMLDLSNTEVSDVDPLSALTRLQSLDISNTNVRNVGPLAALTSLLWLDLSGTQVSDVVPLAALTGLQFLDLSYTEVSDNSLEELQALLPKSRISRSVYP